MSAARFVTFMMLVFVLCAVPFMLVQASGISSAGLSAGFRMPLEQPLMLGLFLLLGMTSAWLKGDGFILVPFATVVMVLSGSAFMMHYVHHQTMTVFIIGGALAFTASLSLARSRETIAAICFSGTIGFHMGQHLLLSMPVMVSPVFYVLGLLLAISLCLAIAVAFSLTLKGEHELSNVGNLQTDL